MTSNSLTRTDPNTARMPAKLAAHERALAAAQAARDEWEAASEARREMLHVPHRPPPPTLSSDDRAAARQIATDLDRPISVQELAVWLAPVNAASRNPQSQADYAIRVTALHTLLDDIPAAAFSHDSRRRLPEFFPAAADIRRATAAEVAAIRIRIEAIADALRPRPAPPPPPPPTERPDAAAIARVRASVEEMRRHQRSQQDEAPAHPRPAHINRQDLLATCKRDLAAMPPNDPLRHLTQARIKSLE